MFPIVTLLKSAPKKPSKNRNHQNKIIEHHFNANCFRPQLDIKLHNTATLPTQEVFLLGYEIVAQNRANCRGKGLIHHQRQY